MVLPRLHPPCVKQAAAVRWQKTYHDLILLKEIDTILELIHHWMLHCQSSKDTLLICWT